MSDPAAHPLDPYFSPTQRDGFSTTEKDAVLKELLKEVHGPKTVAPPDKPTEPEYENIDYIPHYPHTWDKEWDGDYHQGRICSVCGEHSDCDMCNPKALNADDFDCWRNLAEERNYKSRKEYEGALARYEAQMEFWRSIPGISAP